MKALPARCDSQTGACFAKVVRDREEGGEGCQTENNADKTVRKCRKMEKDTPEQDTVTTARLRNLLTERAWSPTRLSLMAGLGKGVVNDILHDPSRQPRRRTVAKLARALGVDTEYLFGESDVRRAASRLLEGASWDDLPKEHKAKRLLEKIDSEIESAEGDLAAYHLPAGAEGLGIPADSTVILSRNAHPETGDLVVVNDPSLGYCIRYLAEPYLIGLDDEGRPRHWLRDKNLRFLGKIILVVRLP